MSAVGVDEGARKVAVEGAGGVGLDGIDSGEVCVVIQVDEAVVLFDVGREVLVAEAVVEGEAAGEAVVVLGVGVEDVGAEVGLEEAGLDLGLLGLAEEEIGDGCAGGGLLGALGGVVEGGGLVGGALGDEAGEGEGAEGIVAADLVYVDAADVRAEAVVVLRVAVGNEVREGDGLVDAADGDGVGEAGEVGEGDGRDAVVKAGLGETGGLAGDGDAGGGGWIEGGTGEEVDGFSRGAVPVEGGIVGDAAVADGVACGEAVAVRGSLAAEDGDDVAEVLRRSGRS